MALLRRTGTLLSLLTSLALAAGLVSGCARTDREDAVSSQDASATARADDDKVVVVAVGDIACPPGRKKTKTTCRQGRTARLTDDLDPDAVLALGDLQYETGSLPAFRNAYATSWGPLRGITYPVPGNHEYRTKDARGYYRYFDQRQPGRPGYYAFDLGDWRVYALNSNCDEIRCRREYRWLRKDLEAHPRDCSLFAMHHPRWSSGGEHGSDEDMGRFFFMAYRYRVDVVLAGHDHGYERFNRLNAAGERDEDGVLSFVSGAGGKSLYKFGETEDGSAYRRSGHFGVLRLALRPDRFRFAFKDVDGSTPDSGRRNCH